MRSRLRYTRLIGREGVGAAVGPWAGSGGGSAPATSPGSGVAPSGVWPLPSLTVSIRGFVRSSPTQGSPGGPSSLSLTVSTVRGRPVSRHRGCPLVLPDLGDPP